MENPFGMTVRPQMAARARVDRLWEDLANAADSTDARVSPKDLAERINLAAPPGRHTLAICRAVYGIVTEASVDPSAAPDAIRRLSELILVLKPAILAAALRSEHDLQARRAFLQTAGSLLSAPAVLRLALAASAAYEQPLSAPLRELLKKLGARAFSDSSEMRAEAERVLRVIVSAHLPVAPRAPQSVYTRGYEDLFDPTAQRRTQGRVTPEADRIVHIALETGAVGEVLWIAVSELVEGAHVRELLEALKRAPETPAVVGVTRRIATPEALVSVLREEPVDFDTVDVLIRAMGIAAAKPLLEEVAESRTRATRRGALERLARLGADIAPLVEARLKDKRWFVIRNMLALLREAGCIVQPHVVQRFVGHTDARVRREAVHLLMHNPRARDEALVTGLRDTDKHVLRAALQNARERLPETAVPTLAQRVTDVDFPPEFRVVALQLLGRSNSTLALDALLHYAQAGTNLLGKPRLANKSPELLAALGGLARTWSHERRARALIDVAANSRDEQIVAAIRGRNEGS
jgi:hypothetical protein